MHKVNISRGDCIGDKPIWHSVPWGSNGVIYVFTNKNDNPVQLSHAP